MGSKKLLELKRVILHKLNRVEGVLDAIYDLIFGADEATEAKHEQAEEPKARDQYLAISSFILMFLIAGLFFLILLGLPASTSAFLDRLFVLLFVIDFGVFLWSIRD